MTPINVNPVNGSSVRSNQQVRVLSALLEIAFMDRKGGVQNRERRKLVNRLPAQLGAYKLDDFLADDPTAHRYPAAELLLTESIESTSIIQEQVHRTVLAGAEKFKVVRDCGAAWYNVNSNSFRVPLGEAQINASVVPEGAEIPDRTQDYSARTFTIKKYGAKPRITNEMVEDGLVDAISEEIFWAGASIENKFNIDSITSLVNNANNTSTYAGAGSVSSATAGQGLNHVRHAISLIKADGFIADTLICCSGLEFDLMANSNLAQAMQYGANTVIAQGRLPTYVYGLRTYVTDNGHATAASWRYTTDGDTAGIVMDAKRALGIAMRRDLTVKRFEDIVRDLQTITVTMRVDQQYLHSNASSLVKYETS